MARVLWPGTDRHLVYVFGIRDDDRDDSDNVEEIVGNYPPDELVESILDGGDDSADENNDPAKLREG